MGRLQHCVCLVVRMRMCDPVSRIGVLDYVCTVGCRVRVSSVGAASVRDGTVADNHAWPYDNLPEAALDKGPLF